MNDFFSGSWLALLIIVAAGYLLGSVNWAIIITRWFSQKDIRSVGSGNAGATNVLRSQGALPAILTTVGDVAKGVLATLLGGWVLVHFQLDGASGAWAADYLFIGRYLGGFFCVMGHLFPVFYQLRGGKGVLSTLGMLLVVDWRVAVLGLIGFGITLAISRMVSLGSIVAAFTITASTFVLQKLVDGQETGMAAFCTTVIGLIAVIVIWKHRGNIQRIVSGTERRIGEDKT